MVGDTGGTPLDGVRSHNVGISLACLARLLVGDEIDQTAKADPARGSFDGFQDIAKHVC